MTMSITLNKPAGVTQSDGTRDSRYTVTREWCGYDAPRYVVRFCGHWVSSHTTESAAWSAAQHREDSSAMAESFTYEALCKRSAEGTISAEGEAWLIGYDRGENHASYADAYGQAIHEEPDEQDAGRWAADANFSYFAAGWAEGVAAWQAAQDGEA